MPASSLSLKVIFVKKETIEWLKKAKEDAGIAAYNLKGRKFNAAVFYAQQASEKALKAVQIEKLGKFEKIHDLLTLAKSVGAPENIIESCASINPYYTITRYPDSEDKIDEGLAKSLLKNSRKVIAWTRQTLRQSN